MLAMAKKSTKPKATQTPESAPPGTTKPQARNGLPLHVWLDPSLRRALDALVADTRRSLTTEVTIALENHLKSAGRWPLPTDKEGEK